MCPQEDHLQWHAATDAMKNMFREVALKIVKIHLNCAKMLHNARHFTAAANNF
jgi:hypothetical protein